MKRHIIGESLVTLTDEGVKESPAKLINTGSVLVVVRSGVLKHTLPVALTDADVTVNQDMKALTPKEHVDPAYLARFIKANEATVLGWVRATTADNFPIEQLLDLQIDLPPLDEQRRIAAILDQADALRAKRQQALAFLDDLTQSIFLELFGAVDVAVRLGDVADFKYGTSNKSEVEGELALRIPNVIRGVIDTSDLKRVPVSADEFDRLRLRAGDVLFVRTNGNPDRVGRCAAFDPSSLARSDHDAERFIYASYLIRARVHLAAADPTFLVAFLTTDEGRKQLRANSKTSAGQYNINIEGLSSVRIPAVSLREQRSFARKVVQVRTTHCQVSENAQRADLLFASLQSRAFSGKL